MTGHEVDLGAALAHLRVLPLGTDGVLIETDGLDESLALFGALLAQPVAGILDVVPAARSVAVRFLPTLLPIASLMSVLRSLPTSRDAATEGRLVEIPVRYDGEDLADVARLSGLSVDEVVDRHAGATYTVAFTGFAPGFAYLTGGDPALAVPRRATPRTSVPAGAVAMAGEFTGVYPRESPGGWQLLGHTDVALWDLAERVPALLQPGMRVRFVDVTTGAAAAEEAASQQRGTTAAEGAASPQPAAAELEPEHEPDLELAERPLPDRALVVTAPGPFSILEDLGRPGRSGLGVSRSGAMDHRALREANRLVGAATGSAALELAYGGLEATARGDLVLAVAGAPVPLTVHGPGGVRHAVPGAAFALDDGEVLVVGAPPRGVYSYLAVRGGWEAESVLDSASGDVLARIGPGRLVAGDELGVGRAWSESVAAAAHDAQRSVSAPDEVTLLDVVLGPRDDWFTAEALERLTGQRFTVTAQSNRIGLRLEGEHPLERAVAHELPSEATVSGALQVPPDGQPVLFMADHPVTGGYPVVACVVGDQLDRAAQVPVGASVRFRVVPGPDLGAGRRGGRRDARVDERAADERGVEQ
ncbi:5-oxoprolinase subunit PxpB [Frigoribacterium sp. PvP032]|uniref:5-oxoprolinase subunit PxpB n=1 Tax=Frigoribacterium sp. PvP032 TaxID=2806589 RepID=UPI001B4F24FC|nr:5-oxoprolinase subunit PxpB [Frigoribacterium sp. PvP032]MBP1191010.1 KipI family sensor histidine kinase inhibitor [Frigoribacterium sp. PvP032]